MTKASTPKADKMFAVRDKATGNISRLVSAGKKGDVIKHLAAAFSVEEVGAVEATKLVLEGISIENATPAAEAAKNGASAHDAE